MIMLPTELTPLVQRQSSRSCSKFVLKTLISVSTFIILISVIYYIGSSSTHDIHSSQLQHENNKIQSIHDHEITVILYPDDIYYLETLDRYTHEWNDYHLQLITTNGYNPLNKSIIYTFTMHDYHYNEEYYKQYLKMYHEEDHHESEQKEPKKQRGERTGRAEGRAGGRKQRPTPPPTAAPKPTEASKKTPYPTSDYSEKSKRVSNGGLTCYAKYSLSERQNTNGYILKCNSDSDTLVGCVGGSNNRDELKRSGEQAVHHGCIAEGESIYIRCCFPADKSVSMKGSVSIIDAVYELNSYCETTKLSGFANQFKSKDNYYMVGCTGWYGTSQGFESNSGKTDKTQTNKIMGTQIIYDMSGEEAYCLAHRGDEKGFIAAPAIIAVVNNAKLDCIIIDSEPPLSEGKIPFNSVVSDWSSMAFCKQGYSLMDCNGYIDGAMDKCNTQWDGKDKVNAVVFHGTDLKCMPDREQHCSANGNTDKIRVQAVCCRVIVK